MKLAAMIKYIPTASPGSSHFGVKEHIAYLMPNHSTINAARTGGVQCSNTIIFLLRPIFSAFSKWLMSFLWLICKFEYFNMLSKIIKNKLKPVRVKR